MPTESKQFLDLRIGVLAVTQRRQKVYNNFACYTLFREFVFLADNTHQPGLTRHIGLDAIKFVSR